MVEPGGYGCVKLNYDEAWVAKSGVPVPKSLDDLTQTDYRGWLLVQNPATSSPGYAFLLATIAGRGEEKAFYWWVMMRANGLTVTQGCYHTHAHHFTLNGGQTTVVGSQ